MLKSRRIISRVLKERSSKFFSDMQKHQHQCCRPGHVREKRKSMLLNILSHCRQWHFSDRGELKEKAERDCRRHTEGHYVIAASHFRLPSLHESLIRFIDSLSAHPEIKLSVSPSQSAFSLLGCHLSPVQCTKSSGSHRLREEACHLLNVVCHIAVALSPGNPSCHKHGSC